MKGEKNMPDWKEANRRIEQAVVEGYKKIEDGAVNGYKKIEDGAVNGYKKIEDKFIARFLAKEGETIQQARDIFGRENVDFLD